MARRADATMWVDGIALRLTKHKRDFSALAERDIVADACGRHHVTIKQVGDGVCRLRCTSPRSRNRLMRRLRDAGLIVHHLYVTELRDEIVLGGHLYLRMAAGHEPQLEAILTEHHLSPAAKIGGTEVLAVTARTNANPIKAAARIAKLKSVEHCAPEFLWQLSASSASASEPHSRGPASGNSPQDDPPHDRPKLANRQWSLNSTRAAPIDDPPLPHVDAHAAVEEAWREGRGDEQIVIAVLDDGFDLQHPVFAQVTMKEGRDFQTLDGEPLRRDQPQPPRNAHGTMVASIALACGGEMEGVAPNCTLLPIRLPVQGFTSPLKLQRALQFASDHAHVVNVSIEFAPRTTDYFEQGFREFIFDIAVHGGLDGRGLAMVVSAGNQDCPTSMSPSQNRRGVRFRVNSHRKRIASGRPIYTGLSNLRQPIVVGASTSTLRKAGYSNWGADLTVVAPSGNGHELKEIDSDFDVPYPGRGMIAAVSRPESTLGEHPPRLEHMPLYTAEFTGTSAAAPMVSGILGLMLSANRQLAAWELKRLLISTADQAMDLTLDHPKDPNLDGNAPQGGEFVDGHSWFFGAGKVNAFRAVRRAKLLVASPLTSARHDGQAAGPWILSSDSIGIVDQLTLGAGIVQRLALQLHLAGAGEVDVQLISPQGYVVEFGVVPVLGDSLFEFNSGQGAATDLVQLLAAQIDGEGVWRLHVSRTDASDGQCRLLMWRLSLET